MTQAKFIPKPGQTDYTTIRYCPVINCVLKFEDKILLVKRSNDLKFYPGTWSGVSGFLDDQKSVEEKVQEELNEELGLSSDKIKEIQRGQVFVVEDDLYKKTWLVFPVLVDVSSDSLVLDWEAQDHQWTSLSKAKELDLQPGFDKVLAALFV